MLILRQYHIFDPKKINIYSVHTVILLLVGLHDGVNRTWSGGLLVLELCIGMIVVRVTVSRGTVSFSPIGIDSVEIG
jgi:hypothetical protein